MAKMKFKVVLFFSSPIAGDVECLRSTHETFMFLFGELICSFLQAQLLPDSFGFLVFNFGSSLCMPPHLQHSW